MGDIVNLRRARKQRMRADAASAADQNRAAHGRTKTERSLSDAERAKLSAHLDAHELPGSTD